MRGRSLCLQSSLSFTVIGADNLSTTSEIHLILYGFPLAHLVPFLRRRSLGLVWVEPLFSQAAQEGLQCLSPTSLFRLLKLG